MAASPPRRPSGATRIQSVSRASQILLWIAEQPAGASAKAAATHFKLTVPTAYHVLNTLADEGLLAKGSHGAYVLGQGASVLAQAYLRGNAVPDALLVAVRELAHITGETTYLADWGNNDIRVLASVESSQMVRVAEVGGPYEHGHARANGKVLLAFAWPEVREAYLRAHPLVPLTSATICDRAALDRELQEIRDRGYAYDREEFAVGVSCVAAPILHDGTFVAALGISAPTHRFAGAKTTLTESLLDVVSRTEPLLGEHGPGRRDLDVQTAR